MTNVIWTSNKRGYGDRCYMVLEPSGNLAVYEVRAWRCFLARFGARRVVVPRRGGASSGALRGGAAARSRRETPPLEQPLRK